MASNSFTQMLPITEKKVTTTVAKRVPQYLATITVSIGAIAAGSALAWTSPVLPQLQSANSTLPLTTSQGTWVGSILAIGALVSAIPAGICAEKIGRKNINLLLAIPFFLNWVLIVFAPNVEMLYVARFFAGVATGSICVTAPMYIGEIAETEIRGTLGSFFQMFLCAGILITFVIGSLVDYITLSKILGVIPVIFAVCFYFSPESPVYLMKKLNYKEAALSIQKLRGENYDVDFLMGSIQREIDSTSGQKRGIKDLFSTKANIKALIASLGLMFFQQFSGINAVIFYTVPIFKSAGSSLDPNLATIIVGIVQVVLAYIACMVIDKAGRRFFLMFSSLLMGICLAMLGLYFYKKDSGDDVTAIGLLPVASLILFIVAFSLGFGPIPWTMMGELFSSDLRGIASGIAVMVNWSLVFVVTKSFSSMLENLGSAATFYTFMGCMIAATMFVFFLVPETRGKTVQEIQDEMSGCKKEQVLLLPV